MSEEKKHTEEQPEENTPEETTTSGTEEQQAINLKPKTEQMEVHKHPHHVTHKKKWGEYLLEFLMIFFAVFCGFLAENYREHQVEKERGKQYIESFYEDLKTDTARIVSYMNYDEEKIAVLNNLQECYDTISAGTHNSACLLPVVRASLTSRPFMHTDRTLNQLFNAGGFRLLNKEDADSIIACEDAFKNFQDFQRTVFQTAQDNVRASFNLLVDFKANTQIFNDGAEPGKTASQLLFPADRALLNKYFNELLLYYRITVNHQGKLQELKTLQARLLGYFKNKYHFE